METPLLTRTESEDGSQKPRRLPWVVAATGIVAMTVGSGLDLFINATTGQYELGLFGAVTFYLLFVSFPVLGAVILRRIPGNALGWVFIFIGVVGGVGFFGQTYARLGFVVQPGRWPLAGVGAWLEQWYWYPTIGSLLGLLPLLFPDGRPLSTRWRIVGWVAGINLGLVTTGGMLERRLSGHGYSIDNPIGLPWITDVESTPLFELFTLVFMACAVLAILSLFLRYRRAKLEQRQQLKWFMFSITLMVLGSVAGDALDLPDILFSFLLAALMGSIAVSVLKYRLYNIDIIINRTLVYGLLTAALLGSYLLIVFGLSRLIDPVTQDSDIAIAASTLAVAAMFQPLRRRIQTFIDHRFYRSKYDATAALADFTARLRDEIDLEAVSADIRGVVSVTMQPAHTSLWIRERG